MSIKRANYRDTPTKTRGGGVIDATASPRAEKSVDLKEGPRGVTHHRVLVKEKVTSREG